LPGASIGKYPKGILAFSPRLALAPPLGVPGETQINANGVVELSRWLAHNFGAVEKLGLTRTQGCPAGAVQKCRRSSASKSHNRRKIKGALREKLQGVLFTHWVSGFRFPLSAFMPLFLCCSTVFFRVIFPA
jgi:hypothetical protein